MSKPLLGLLLGALLGLIDGLSAMFYPEAVPEIMSIVIGSTVKGLLTGVVMGWLAKRYHSLPVGIIGGLLVGLALSFLAALAADLGGRHPYLEIMLPGGVLGMIVGFATQRGGRRSRASVTA